jgi:hypothetical protein
MPMRRKALNSDQPPASDQMRLPAQGDPLLDEPFISLPGLLQPSCKPFQRLSSVLPVVFYVAYQGAVTAPGITVEPWQGLHNLGSQWIYTERHKSLRIHTQRLSF